MFKLKLIPDFTDRDVRRFWAFVQKGDECWTWQGGTGGDNDYGLFTFDGHSYKAHRCMWKLAHGEPGEMRVLHHCDNPICVRPDHLFLGTLADNARDAVSKGRHRGVKNLGDKKAQAKPGEQHHNAKLTEQQVLDARRRHAAGESALAMCEEFGVNPRTLSRAIKGATWKHLEIEEEHYFDPLVKCRICRKTWPISEMNTNGECPDCQLDEWERRENAPMVKPQPKGVKAGAMDV